MGARVARAIGDPSHHECARLGRAHRSRHVATPGAAAAAGKSSCSLFARALKDFQKDARAGQEAIAAEMACNTRAGDVRVRRRNPGGMTPHATGERAGGQEDAPCAFSRPSQQSFLGGTRTDTLGGGGAPGPTGVLVRRPLHFQRGARDARGTSNVE